LFSFLDNNGKEEEEEEEEGEVEERVMATC
jgi:hypothetical protein